jgi:mRNA-degrading endonuclease RelE of RelBE toxin-antitoxin system
MTAVETPGFLRDAAAAFEDGEKTRVILFLAENPEAGDIMPGTGGGRKLRWRGSGRGKRGGVRVIYYFHDESVPLFLLSVFAKNEKATLTAAERNEMKALLPRLIDGYRKGTRR